ncbi:MAG: hypothetical protein QHC90_29325 [Shinella sp.]|nr:hypothetical protein [Shinella sp.]
MADSDDTTTLSSVTRRMLLAGTMAATATWPFRYGAGAGEVPAGNTALDPALLLWHEWRAAWRNTVALCRKQQKLETQLVKVVGFPCAKVHLPDEDVTVTFSWYDEIEDYFGDDPGSADTRAKAGADLAAHQARWDAEDERIGYSAAKREEGAAADREQDLMEALMATPAATLAGVAAKLDALLREGEYSEDCTEFPWPQMRSALIDLVRIGQVLQPGLFMPGSDREGRTCSRARYGTPNDRQA